MSDRKVHFSVPLHQIEYLDKHWETASRLARDGSDWLRMGLDRLRFKDRIERTAEILDRILDDDFRQLIYQERFENFVIEEQPQTIRKENSPQPQPSTASNITESKQVIESTAGTSQQQQHQEQSQKRSLTQNNHRRGRRKKGNNKRRKHRGGHRR